MHMVYTNARHGRIMVETVKGMPFLILSASMGIDRAARKFTDGGVAARKAAAQGHVASQSAAHSAFWRVE